MRKYLAHVLVFLYAALWPADKITKQRNLIFGKCLLIALPFR